MPGPITIHDDELAKKDPHDSSVFIFDWDVQHLAVGVTLTAFGTFAIVDLEPIAAWDALVEYVIGDRVTLAGVIYTAIVTTDNLNETPPNTDFWTATGTVLALTKDNESLLAGNRKTQLRLIGGTVGQQYRIDNKVTTSETPAQIKERSFFVLIQD